MSDTPWGMINQQALQDKQFLYDVGSTWFASQMAQQSNAKAVEMQYWMQKQAQKWSEQMSNTAHQREVKDLKLAGLNPILSANGGATTPGSISPSVPQADTSMWNNLAGKNLREGALTNAQIDEIKEQTELMRNQQDETFAKTALLKSQELNTKADTILKNKEADVFDKKWAMYVKETTSRIEQNYINQALMRSEISVNDTRKQFINSQRMSEEERKRLLQMQTRGQGIENILRAQGNRAEGGGYNFGISGPHGIGINYGTNSSTTRY